MKSFLLVCFVMSVGITKAAVITWDGGGADGLWNTAANWNGDILPGPGDDVLLDNSLVSVSYTVTMPAGTITTSIHSLIITPAGVSVITLILPSSNRADPCLSVTGMGDAIQLNNNAVLRNSSGASSGPGLVITNTFRINNGGRYIHNTGRANAAIVSQLSTAAGTELGIFEYDVPSASYTVSLSNRTYGTLEFSAVTNGNAVSYVGNGANPLRINGDLKINTKVTVSIAMSGDCIVQRNYIQAPASVFDCQSATNNNFIKIQGDLLVQGTMTKLGSGMPVVELNGTADQHISVTGNIANNIALKINNPAGITLTTPLSLPYNLQLINGRIRTDAVNILTMVDNTSYTGGSVVSFVEGPMRKTGDDDFTFPVGKGQIYAPVRIAPDAGASVTDQFMAEYMRSNPQSTYGMNYQLLPPPNNIDHISYVEYWNLSSNTVTAVSKYLSLTVNCASFCKSFGSLFIAGYNTVAAQWINKGQSASMFSSPALCPAYLTGTITAGPVNEFSHFTLASSQPFAINPLPVELISINVKWQERKTVIDWETASFSSGKTKFEIERAGADRRYIVIGGINGNENSRYYNYADNAPGPGINYYRLKIINENADVVYSRVVEARESIRDLSLLSFSQNVTSSKAILSVVSSYGQTIELVIMDVQGRVIRREYQYVSGNTLITVSLNDLSGGMYFLFGVSKKGKTNVIRFIKQ